MSQIITETQLGDHADITKSPKKKKKNSTRDLDSMLRKIQVLARVLVGKLRSGKHIKDVTKEKLLECALSFLFVIAQSNTKVKSSFNNIISP